MSNEKSLNEYNFIIFIAEAIGHNRKVHKDVDKLYQLNKNDFHKLAKQSKMYEHTIFKEGDIYREIYAKKALGIMLYLIKHSDVIDNSENNYEYSLAVDINEKFNNIIKKGWNRAYKYVINNDEINLGDFLFHLRSANIRNDDDINTEVFMAYWIASGEGKKIAKDEMFRYLKEMLDARIKHASDGSKYRMTYKSLSKKVFKNATTLKQRIYGEYGKINSYNSIFMDNFIDIEPGEFCNKKPADFTENEIFDENDGNVVAQIGTMISIIIDSEKLSLSSVFNNIKLKEKDVDEILAIYYVTVNNKNTKNAAKFLVWGILIKGLCKAFKDVKDQYFKLNHELINIEAENQEDKISSLEDENTRLKEKVKNLEKSIDNIKKDEEKKYMDKIKSLENKVSRLENELAEEKQKDRELIALREFLFSLDQGHAPGERSESLDLSNFTGVIVGGHPRWQDRISEYLPGWKFISNENFNERLLHGVDVVFFNTQFLNHSLYYKVVNEAKRHDISIGYINSTNEKLTMREIQDRLKIIYSDNT